MSGDKFRLIKSGWDRDCLYNIQDGDRILVRWEDGTETFEIARTDSSASYGQEQPALITDEAQTLTERFWGGTRTGDRIR